MSTMPGKRAVTKVGSYQDKVYRYIKRYPGVYFRKISEALHISRGTLGRILVKLEYEKKIMTTFDGYQKRYYRGTMTIREMPMPLTPMQKKVYDYVARNQGATYKMIAKRLKRTPEAICRHTGKLVMIEMIREETIDREKHFFTEDVE